MGKGYVILLALSDRETMRSIREELKSIDIVEDCIFAFNGREALEKVRTGEVDLAVLDVILQEIDGIGVLEAVKTDPALWNTRVVLLTCAGNDFIKSLAFELGADYFMDGKMETGLFQKRIRELLIYKRAMRWTDTAYDTDEIMSDSSAILKRLGMGMNSKGYAFLRDGLMLYIQEPSCLDDLSERMYPLIAEKYSTTAACVERNMRTALEKAWGRGDMDFAEQLFGYSIDEEKGKPTNMAFIATVADYMMANHFHRTKDKRK